MIVGHKHICLCLSLFHNKNCKILIVLAISTCAYMWSNRVGIMSFNKNFVSVETAIVKHFKSIDYTKCMKFMNIAEKCEGKALNYRIDTFCDFYLGIARTLPRNGQLAAVMEIGIEK